MQKVDLYSCSSDSDLEQPLLPKSDGRKLHLPLKNDLSNIAKSTPLKKKPICLPSSPNLGLQIMKSPYADGCSSDSGGCSSDSQQPLAPCKNSQLAQKETSVSPITAFQVEVIQLETGLEMYIPKQFSSQETGHLLVGNFWKVNYISQQVIPGKKLFENP